MIFFPKQQYFISKSLFKHRDSFQFKQEDSSDSSTILENMLLDNEDYVGMASDQILDNSSAKKKQNWTKESVDLQMRQVNLEGITDVNKLRLKIKK